MPLSAKHALVTGGGTGIGRAIAQRLAGAGATVTITGRRAAPLQETAAATPGLFPLEMDVSDEKSVISGFDKATTARGPVQILIANAGIAEGRSLLKTDLAFWRQMMSINLDGAFLTIREGMRSMETTDWGRVIAVSSIAGVSGLKGASTYTASKHGMLGLIRALSADYATRPYTFNALCPGYVDTDIIDRNVTSIQSRAGVTAEAARAMMVDLNPHGRLITPDEVAEAALWLCAPGSASVDGQAIQISGGQP